MTFQRLPQANLPSSLEGKVAIITGGNRGLGLETSKIFASLGARVFIACRNQETGKSAVSAIRAEINEKYRGNLFVVPLDLASFDSIYKCAQILSQATTQIDYLINNGGIMMTPESRSEDGFELQFATNYLGHFLLTNLLLNRLKASPQARIVNLTSISYRAYIINFDNINLAGGAYSSLRGYSQSKLAIILFTYELGRRLRRSKTNITAYVVHPGLIKTELYEQSSWFTRIIAKYMGWIGMISSRDGIQTTLYCAFEPHLANESGHYYQRCKRVDKLNDRVNEADAQRLWILSAQLCGFEA